MLEVLDPNYNNPMRAQYRRLLNLEGQLVGVIEYHKENGNLKQMKGAIRFKKLVSVRRQIMKAALKQKQKQSVLPTLTA